MKCCGNYDFKQFMFSMHTIDVVNLRIVLFSENMNIIDVFVLSYTAFVTTRKMLYEGTYEVRDFFHLCELHDIYECYSFFLQTCIGFMDAKKFNNLIMQ